VNQAQGSVRAETRARRSRLAGPGWLPWAYLAPALLLYEWDGLSPSSSFVGVQNYLAVMADPRLREAFGHALVLILFYAVVPLLIGLPLASLLTRASVRGLGFFRVVIFLPQVIAMVVVAVTWRQLYAPDGPINALLRAVGLGALARPWLGDFFWTLPAVGLVGTWVSTGLVTVLLMAGMARIPKELFEAARLDGAGPVSEFFAVTLPSVRGEIAVALTLTIVAALKTFDLVYVTTRGGPGTSTTVPSYEVYRNAFELGKVGIATAIGILLTAIIFAINLVVNRIGDRS
jgi:raffinose/stachyose/melibiose transport system permease protein